MTLKYESELLFDLMKRDGDDAPSDVLPYESELKEKYLNQVVGAYPKLQDYQPEWLNYNLYHHLPSDFPVESVANVTSASFNNVVPYAYKSAILKGKTINNLWSKLVSGVVVQQKTDDTIIENYSEQYNRITFGETQVNSATTIDVETTQQLQANKTYYINTFVFDGFYGTDSFLIRDISNNINLETLTIEDYPTGQILSFTTQGETNRLKFYYFAHSRKYGGVNYGKPFYIPKRFVISDKLEDVINQGFFKGMQSVKMPVLNTVGKNLWDNNNFVNGVISGDSVKLAANDLYRTIFYYNFKENQQYVFSLSSYSENKKLIYFKYNYTDRTDSGFTFFLPYNGERKEFLSAKGKTISYISFIFSDNDVYTLSNIQLEEGNVATSYEPFKSNILTVDEEVELRGIGDVQDELDLLTGEFTENIGEMIINGNEAYYDGAHSSNYYIYFRFNYHSNSKPLISDKLPTAFGALSKGCLSIYSYDWGDAICYTPVNATNIADAILELKSYGDIRVQYVKKEKSIKTVDLSCINEQGESETFRPIEGTMHVNTSSQTLKPLLDMSVPVEATSQNLMSFANIVEEE